MSLAQDLIGVKSKGKRRARSSPTPQPRRPDNVPREVYLLTGGVTPPSIMPTTPAAALKSKPKQQTKWRFTPFVNSARKDGLQLGHYAKAGEPQTDYTFARFNRKIQLVRYTDKEYAEVIEKLSPLVPSPNNIPIGSEFELDPKKPSSIYKVAPQRSWTKAETDALFKLCEDYDFRFVVIQDRWPEEEFGSRGVDELKDRYYSVAKRLIEYRQQKDPKYFDTLSSALHKHCHSICMNPFDYEYERIRKNQLEVQYHRSKAELKEEEETVREARRIEANRKRVMKERQRLTKLLTPAGDIGLTRDGKALIALAGSNGAGKLFPHRKMQTGAFSRSSLIYAPVTQSSRISKRIDQVLDELGVGTRPMPTSILVDLFDLLRMDILKYIELHRTVMRKEEDTHALRVKLARLRGEQPPQPPPGVGIAHKKRKIDDVLP